MLFKDMFGFCAGLGNAPAARQQNGSRLKNNCWQVSLTREKRVRQ